MTKTPFFGRQRERRLLERLKSKRSASLVVIKGRRRIGKSRLAEEFGQTCTSYTFVGQSPSKDVTAQMQREDFVRQMEQQLPVRAVRADDWSDIFWLLGQQVQEGRTLVVFDEINWMGNKDPTFLGKLKTAWDVHFKKNPQLIMILSGSMSSWIENEIVNSTGFLGRISINMTLDELPLSVCNQFWQPQSDRISAYEKFKVLAVTGGVPRYLEEIHPEWTAEANIQALCFEPEGLLFQEFDHIFSDLFSRRGDTYKKIIRRLAAGSTDQQEMALAIGMGKGGTVAAYLEDLVVSGYVARDYTWHLNSGKVGKLSRYRLKDNYLRFYLKYVEPNRRRIEQNEECRLTGWDGIMGLQFENLVLSSRKILRQLLNFPGEDLLFDNPYFQKETKQQRGCQIDYLIQSRYNSLYLCEIKLSKDPIPAAVIEEVEEKIRRLGAPRRYSIRPVLVHVNGVTEPLRDAGFFSHIIDFGQLLEVSK